MTEPDTPLISRHTGAPTLGDAFASLAEAHRHRRDVARDELAYFIERRDKLTERMRFGLAALNGASLVALISALGGKGEAAIWLGFTHENAIWSASAFTLGLILTGYSVYAQQNLYIREAGDAVTRASTLAGLASRYNLTATKGNVEELGEALTSEASLPLVGFQYSPTSIWAQNLASGAWLMGILTPLLYAICVSP